MRIVEKMGEERWMQEALRLAEAAALHDDVPVGAVVIGPDGDIVGRGKNERELRELPSAHAEVMAINEAATKLGNWNLSQCTLVVTLEPCLMCTGLIMQSRISRVIWGADDAKGGAVISSYAVGKNQRLHYFDYEGGILKDECCALLQNFFKRLRARVLVGRAIHG